MAVNWEDYLHVVMPDVAGCPISQAENAIRLSAIEFCNQSRVYRLRLADLDSIADQSEYTIVVPAGSEMIALHKIQEVTAGQGASHRPLPAIPWNHYDRFREQQESDHPRYFLQNTPQTITLLPTPDLVYNYQLWAVLKPTKAALDGPDFLFNDWLEPIAHGAIARLQVMNGRAWSAPNMVKFHRGEFINGWMEARTRDVKANTVNSSTGLSPFGFGNYRTRRYY